MIRFHYIKFILLLICLILYDFNPNHHVLYLSCHNYMITILTLFPDVIQCNNRCCLSLVLYFNLYKLSLDE